MAPYPIRPTVIEVPGKVNVPPKSDRFVNVSPLQLPLGVFTPYAFIF
jgi:hypothetical protein